MSDRISVLHGHGPAVDSTPASVEGATVASTPATLAEDVFVTVGEDRRKIGPVLGWRTAPEAAWPTRGDAALITQVPQGDYWFIGWEPIP